MFLQKNKIALIPIEFNVYYTITIFINHKNVDGYINYFGFQVSTSPRVFETDYH